jgi:hypothetical protein
MIERGEHCGLALEPPYDLFGLEQLPVQYFDDRFALNSGLLCQICSAEASDAKLFQDPILPKRRLPDERVDCGSLGHADVWERRLRGGRFRR